MCVVLACVCATGVRAQIPAAAPAQPATPAAPEKSDALGRDTPRGTVLGFLTAARKGESELAGAVPLDEAQG